MVKIRKSFVYLIITISLFLFSCLSLEAAGSVSTSMSGTNSYVGNNVEVTVTVTGLNGVGGNALTAFSGSLNYDSNYLEYVSYQSLAPFSITYIPSTNRFNGLDMTRTTLITGYSNIIKFTFRAKAVGNTTVSISRTSSSDLNDEVATVNASSKTISIVNPPSSNANLSSLSISSGSISFNPNTTSYSVRVGKDVSSVSVNATPEDGGARVSGTGQKSLNYGYNSISVTVTAPSGATKTYTINVTREDPRSGNSNLSNLTVEGGTLSPSFDSNTTVYEVSVPFSVENLNVKATPQDSKARVSVSGAEGLISEETKDVTVTVTAENGAKKSYTIRVTRGKDPNKVLATNNYLSSLTSNIGILSPVFDKEKLNYVIYLPYEVDTISFDTTVEDTKYGVLTKDGPEKLSVGSNKYTFTVSAEDSSTRVYTVIVVRGANVEEIEASTNVLLKELNIDKGSLDKPFNSNVNVYRYDKKKGFNYKPIPEDEEANVIILENNDVISIIVESGNDVNVYTLIPKEESDLALIIAIASAGGAFVIGGSFVGYRIGFKKNPNRVRKINKNDNDIPKDNNLSSNIEQVESQEISNEKLADEVIIEDKNPFSDSEVVNDYFNDKRV